jgi:lysophospholipase L1-like esterase
VEDRAADAKATGEAVGELKTQIGEISESTENLWIFGDVGPFTKNSEYLWLPAPLTPGTYTFYADVLSDDTYSQDCRVYLARSDTGSTTSVYFLITRGTHQRATFTIPDDVTYADGFLFYAGRTASQSDGDTASYSNIMLLVGDVTETDYFAHLTAKDLTARGAIGALHTEVESVAETVENVTADVNDINELIELYNSGNLLNYNTITPSQRIRVSDKQIVSATNQDVSDYIPVLPGIRITLNYYLDSGNYGNAFYDKGKNQIGNIMSGWEARKNFVVPDGAYFMRLTIPKANLVSGAENAQVNYANLLRTVINEKTSWLALGDSITYGVYSNGPDDKVDDTNGWVNRLATALDYRLNNQGVRGMGFVAVGGNGISWANTLDTVDSLTDTYNLITVALGINDYNTSSVTIADISTAIDTGIQRLMAKYPEARLVFITPFNSNRRGDATTNYCYNYAYGGRSLKDIADLIKDRCEYYGVECIYASNGFLLNNYNMATLLPDQTHPSYFCHTLIAKNMAHYLFM